MTAVAGPGLPALPRSRPRLDPEVRRIGAVALVVVAVAVAAVVATATLGGRTATYAPGTPEAVFQDYLQRLEAGDLDGAYGSFSAGVRSRLPLASFEQQVDQADGPSVRVQIDRAEITGDIARLRLTIDRWWAGGLQSSRWREERTIRLVREAGAWRIDEALAGLDPAW